MSAIQLSYSTFGLTNLDFLDAIDAVDRALHHICSHDGVWLATGSEIAAQARVL